MTLTDVHSHSHITSLSSTIFPTVFAALEKISTDTRRRAVPLRQQSFLFWSVVSNFLTEIFVVHKILTFVAVDIVVLVFAVTSHK